MYAPIQNLGLFLNTRRGPWKALNKVRTRSDCFNKITLPEGREWIAKGKSERGEVSMVGGRWRQTHGGGKDGEKQLNPREVADGLDTGEEENEIQG